jgi:CelD/BcsL family acetyltransferase involved in cellulose biosynthesis
MTGHTNHGHDMMKVDMIDRYDAFVALRADWDAAYASDPDANYFLSWTFMSTWLGKSETFEKRNSEGWFVLAVRDDRREGRYVAFLPMRLRQRRSPRGNAYVELSMGGRKYADYTGLVSRPEHRKFALPALLAHIATLPWAQWRLEFLRLPEGEIAHWLAPFSCDDYAIRRLTFIDPEDPTDQSVCPYIPLTASWESYLDARLSSNSRQKLRRLLRQIEGSTCRISHVRADTVERDIKVLLHLWRARWRDRKGEKLESLMNLIGTMLMRNFRVDTLFLPVLWHSGRPIGALGCFIDREKRSLLFVISGREAAFDGPSPGLILHAHCIQWAIAHGCTTYDFLRGNEPYKYSFGVEERRLDSLLITRRRAVCARGPGHPGHTH